MHFIDDDKYRETLEFLHSINEIHDEERYMVRNLFSAAAQMRYRVMTEGKKEKSKLYGKLRGLTKKV
jgi:hypothetical protein